MKIILFQTSILGLLFVIYSCDGVNQRQFMDANELQEISIDASQKTSLLPTDSLFDCVHFIKLETTSVCMMGGISQLFFVDSLIILVDNQTSKSVYFFDMNGQYKYKISKLGKGPEEFLNIWNICLTPDKNQLVIYDNLQHQMLFYDLNAQFIKVENQPFMMDYFVFLSSGHRAYNVDGMYDESLGENKNKSLIVTTSNNQLVYGFSERQYGKDFNYSKNRILRNCGEKTYFSPNISDIIYEITAESIVPKYHVNLGESALPTIEESITNEAFLKLLNTHLFFNGDFVELKDYTYLNVMTPNGYPGVIYNHKTKSTFLQSGFCNHPFYEFINNQAPLAAYGENSVVVAANPFDLLSKKDVFYKDKLLYKNDLDAIYNDINENSNPVLFVYRINKNLGIK